MEHTVTITMTKTYNTDDLINILSCITMDCPWCSDIDYRRDDYKEAKARLIDKVNKDIYYVCYEDVLVEILEGGKSIWFIDAEDDYERYELTLDKLLNGIALNAKNRPHDCDIDNGDGITMDCIIQYALFDDVIFG